jgi:hypothetical protein
MEQLKYNKVFTERLLIKDDVFRSVHVTANGRANWVIKYGENLVSVKGRKEGNKFIADEKYSHVIESYTPKRISRKQNGIVKSVAQPTEMADCFYMGEKRRVAYSSRYNRIGRIHFRGETIKVKVDDNMIAVKYGVE